MDDSGKRAGVARLRLSFAVMLVGAVSVALGALGIGFLALTPGLLLGVGVFALVLGVGGQLSVFGFFRGSDGSALSASGVRALGVPGFKLAQGVREVCDFSVAGYQERYAAKVDRLVAGVLGADGSSSGVRLSAARKALVKVREELQGARGGHDSVNFPVGGLDADDYLRVLDSVEVRVSELLGLVNQEGARADDVLESLDRRLNLSADEGVDGYRGPQA